ncbi:MAG: ATP-binding protein [Bdellovibrionota bacterium]|nr:MAG: ATP-binding protein [Bdellovibrionota bacterium]
MERKDFGVLYGQRTTEDSLLIYSSYEDAKASPKIGDFIVLTPKNEGGIKYLARVEAEVYDEDPLFRAQDKTLVAVHYARIAERELSDRDKQKMFSYTYKVKLLGTFEHKSTSIQFTTAVRKLPVVSYHARHLHPAEVTHILNMGNQSGVELGFLCVGEDIQKDKGAILFDTKRLRSKRTMVFAQSGFGKTNLMKVLLYHIVGDTSFGKLIFDLNGEYFSKSASNTIGLGDIDDERIRDNLVVYSDRRIANPKGFRYGGKVQINTHRHMTVGDILNFSAGFSEVMKSFLLYLDDAQLEGFIGKIDQYCESPQNLYRDFPDFFGKKASENGKDEKKDEKADKSARGTIMAIRKRIRHFIDEGGVHSSSSSLLEDTFKALKAGKTVIIDLSLRDSVDASIISTMIIRKLFEDNKRYYTEAKEESVINTVILVEEAQNVLSDEHVKTSANPFVRVAKEGRKFGIGLIAVTQRPSAISEEIRSQAENFFTFYMGNSDDIRALVKSNINYDGVISSFVQRETIPGNLYFVTSSHPFVIPIRVVEFEKLVAEKLYK